MKLEYNLYDSGVLVGYPPTYDELLIQFAHIIAEQEKNLLDSQADSSIKHLVIEIDKVFEDGDVF